RVDQIVEADFPHPSWRHFYAKSPRGPFVFIEKNDFNLGRFIRSVEQGDFVVAAKLRFPTMAFHWDAPARKCPMSFSNNPLARCVHGFSSKSCFIYGERKVPWGSKPLRYSRKLSHSG